MRVVEEQGEHPEKATGRDRDTGGGKKSFT